MDVCFSLLLPNPVELDRIEGLERRQVTFTWGGVAYPQDPVKFRWGEYVELIETPIAEHYYPYLPADSRSKTWTSLVIGGKALDMLAIQVNERDAVDWQGRSLEGLLQLLVSHYSQWVLVFELHCDQIDSIYSLSIDECLQYLRESIL